MMINGIRGSVCNAATRLWSLSQTNTAQRAISSIGGSVSISEAERAVSNARDFIKHALSTNLTKDVIDSNSAESIYNDVQRVMNSESIPQETRCDAHSILICMKTLQNATFIDGGLLSKSVSSASSFTESLASTFREKYSERMGSTRSLLETKLESDINKHHVGASNKLTNLTEDQYMAILAYADPEDKIFELLNMAKRSEDFLKCKDMLEYFKTMTSVLDSAIELLPEKSGTYYRGVNATSNGPLAHLLQTWKDAFQSGEPIQLKGLTSCTPDENQCFSTTKGYQTQMVIKGAAKDISAFHPYETAEQNEHVFPSDTELRINNITECTNWNGEPLLRFTCESKPAL